MRRVSVPVCIAAVVVSTWCGVASAQTTTTVSKLGPHECGLKKVSFLYWPSGHGPSTQYSFPSFPVPHVEVYKAAPYQNFDFLAYFDDKGDPAYGATRTPGTAVTGKIAAIKSRRQLEVLQIEAADRLTSGRIRATAQRAACAPGSSAALRSIR